MKTKEKKLARQLRKKGCSLKEIRQEVGVAKSTVSLWVRDIELTAKQKQTLSEKGIKKEVIERRRKTRIDRENDRRQLIIDAARREIKTLSKKDLKLIGIALYWAEGARTQRGRVQVANTDPRLIRLMMRFFKQVCTVPNKKFRGHVNIHPHLEAVGAERYWHRISGIPLNQFYKTSKQRSKASKGKKDSLPYGTFSIEIPTTELFLKIKGWIDGLSESQIKK